ncbi:lipopolysaccharide biosynthesis protein [Spirochaetia bacterium]|nr:lipopolysaccharide biosynthesis protein [Spirochaetia bacterium]
MENNIKNKTVRGVFWSSIERFSVQGVQFVLGIIIARLLEPSDYGIIGMLAIFLAVSQTVIDSGFSSALIRKQDRTEIDFSTVFYFNIFIGIVFYLILFFVSPVIALFFKTPILEDLVKVVALNLLFNSLAIVQRTKLTIQVDFKTQTKVSLIAVLLSGIVGLIMAYVGLGIWALAFQSVLNAGLNVVFLCFFSRWKPLWVFSIRSFKELFSYGSKLLLSALIDTLYNNIYTIIIGKLFRASDLGNYTRANQFAQFPSSNLTEVFHRVAFPMLSDIQHNDEKLKMIYRQYLRMAAFIIFPLMCGFAAVASPFIMFILTEKWIGIVPLLQLLCFSYMLYPVHAINLNLLQVKGRSDLFLKLEVMKKCIGTAILCVTIPFGISGMCIGGIFTSIIGLVINTHYTGKIISIGFFRQMIDLLPILFSSLSMFFIVYFITSLIQDCFIGLLVGFLSGVVYYALLNIIIKSKEMKLIIGLINFRGK